MARYQVDKAELKRDIENFYDFKIFWTPRDLRPGDPDPVRIWKEKNGRLIYDLCGTIEALAEFDRGDWRKFHLHDADYQKFALSHIKKLRSGLDDNDNEIRVLDRTLDMVKLSRLARVTAKKDNLYRQILDLAESDPHAWSKALYEDIRTRRYAHNFGLIDKIRNELQKVPDTQDKHIRYTLPFLTKKSIDEAADDIVNGYVRAVHDELTNLGYDLDPAILGKERDPGKKSALKKLRAVLGPHNTKR